jgi:hypothetical protein
MNCGTSFRISLNANAGYVPRWLPTAEKGSSSAIDRTSAS